jgi:hypothetical protein
MLASEDSRRSFLHPSQPEAFLFYCGLMLCVALGVALLKNALENRLLRAQLEMSRQDECQYEPAAASTDITRTYPIPLSASAGMPNAAKPPRQRAPLTTGVLFSPEIRSA